MALGFLQLLSAIPLRPEHHRFDVKVRFFGGVVDANQHFIFLQAEARDFRQGNERVRSFAADHVDDLICDQNIFRAERARLDLSSARHGGHETMLRPQAIGHAHADDRALLGFVRLCRHQSGQHQQSDRAENAFHRSSITGCLLKSNIRFGCGTAGWNCVWVKPGEHGTRNRCWEVCK